MYKIIFKYFLVAVSVISCNSAFAGGRGSYTPDTPQIVKTSIDTKENILIISGRNFGATSPAVTMGDQVLEVQRFSELEVIARLPSKLAAATYGIMLTTTGARNRANSNLFSATHFR